MTLTPLPTFLSLIRDNALSIDSSPVRLVSSPLTRTESNVFLSVRWVDARGHPCAAQFAEGVNQQIATQDGSYTLIDTDNEVICLTCAQDDLP